MDNTTKRQYTPMLCGTGIVRSKFAPDSVLIREGKISLPNIGQCYVDGVHSSLVASCTLDVRRAGDKKVVAKLIMPISKAESIEGSVVTLDDDGKVLETWKLVATLRRGQMGNYRALRLPDVKIAPAEMREWRKATKNVYAAV